MSDDAYLLDEGDTPAAPEPQAPTTDWEAEAKKAFAERDKARQELRRTTIEAEHGPKIAELVAKSGRPPAEWPEYAAELAELRGQAPPETQAPPASEEEAEPPTPVEQQLAGAIGGPATGTSPPATDISDAEIVRIGQKNPAEAERLIASKQPGQATGGANPYVR